MMMMATMMYDDDGDDVTCSLISEGAEPSQSYSGHGRGSSSPIQ